MGAFEGGIPDLYFAKLPVTFILLEVYVFVVKFNIILIYDT
jgi:hypothetical protein